MHESPSTLSRGRVPTVVASPARQPGGHGFGSDALAAFAGITLLIRSTCVASATRSKQVPR